MNNLEAKQEAIKKAYGEYLEEVRRCIDEKGWCSFNLKKYFKEDLIDSKVYRDKLLYRPKSLQGIENNNGWIKVESEADLPKNDDDYWVMTSIKDDEVQQLSNLIVIRCLNLEKNIKITHYKPIEKPKSPIY